MNLAKIQIEKVTAILKHEGLKRGISLSPFELEDLLAELYAQPGKAPGVPLTNPTFQQPRELFDVPAYNQFVTSLSVDLDVITSFIRRNSLEARNLLVFNDVEMRRLSARLDEVATEVSTFFEEASDTSDTPLNVIKNSISFRQVSYSSVSGSNTLFVDSDNGVLSLNPSVQSSLDIDMNFLNDVTEAVSISVPSSSVSYRKEQKTLGALSRTDASPWLFELQTIGTVPHAAAEIVIPLPVIQNINKIAVSPIPGASYALELFISKGESGWVSVGKYSRFNRKSVLYFSPTLTDAVKIKMTAAPSASSEPNTSFFLFGLTSIQIGNVAFERKGSIVLTDIAPDINNRPIISVELSADQELPMDTSAKYFISLNGESKHDPDILIEGTKSEGSAINFSIASNLFSPKTEVTRTSTLSFTRNGVEFSSLFFSALGDLSTADRTYLPELTDMWLGQNILKTDDFPDFLTKSIEDAVVRFGAIGSFAEIEVPLVLDNLAVSRDSRGNYIKLPLPMAYVTKYQGSVTSDTDVIGLMKTVQDGVFKVEVYKSTNKENPTIVNSVIVDPLTDDRKIYITGSYEFDDVFSVSYLASLTNEVVITKGSVKLHAGTGRNGSTDSNQIPLSSGKFRIDYNESRLKVIDSSLANSVVYVNFTALFDTSTLKVYEAYLYVDDFHTSIDLDRKILVDQESGEYALMRHVSTGSTTRLDNAVEIRDLKKGWHFLSVVSKPLTNLPSAIKSLLSVKDQGDDDLSRVFSLTSSKIISKLGVWDKPNKYVDKEVLFNTTKRVGPVSYSSTIINNSLHFIAPSIGYDFISADSVDNSGNLVSGTEQAYVDVTYFPSNLFKDDVHFSVNIKIELENTKGSSIVTKTPIVNSLALTYNYL